jgi:LysM repeat protein
MRNENPNKDQADQLRRKIENVDKSEKKPSKGLPPRASIHREKKKKNKFKIKYPLIKLLALIFILLPITIFSIYTYKSNEAAFKKTAGESSGFETVNFETKIEKKEANKKEDEEGKSDETSEQSDNQSKIDIDESKPKTTVVAPRTSNSYADDKNENSKVESEDKASEDEGKVLYHQVNANETLYRIAMKYYQSQEGIEKIKKANNIQGNEIQAGQILKILVEE